MTHFPFLVAGKNHQTIHIFHLTFCFQSKSSQNVFAENLRLHRGKYRNEHYSVYIDMNLCPFFKQVVEETYEVQWKIKNFLKILQSNAVETLKLAIVTGESSSSESKWIFGFHKRNSKWYEEPCYLEAIHLPQYMDQIAVKLLVQNVPTNNIRKEWRGKATHVSFFKLI